MVKTRLLDQFQTYFTHFVALDTLRCWNIVLGRTFQDFLPETVCPMQTSFQINRIRYKCIYVLTILWLMWVAEAYIYINVCWGGVDLLQYNQFNSKPASVMVFRSISRTKKRTKNAIVTTGQKKHILPICPCLVFTITSYIAEWFFVCILMITHD